MSRCSQCGELTKPKIEDPIAPGFDTSTTAHHLRLLCTNEPPEDSILAYIQDIVSKTRVRLATLENNISDLRAQLKQLEDEHSLLSDSLHKNTTITSPLRRMPPELLAGIFMRTLPKNYREPAKIGQSPWVLSHICSRWRAIALSIPSLWSKFYIASAVDDPNLYPPLPMIETQIHRARTLSIHFFGSETSNSTPQIEIFELLSKHSERWEEFSIQLTSALVPRLSVLQGRLAELRKLWVQWDDQDSAQGVDSIKYFQSAPSLVDAGFVGEARFIPVLLPVHQLTIYRVDVPWAEHMKALRAAPNLIEAQITVSFQDEPWPKPNDTVIDMLHLRRLSVSDVQILRILRAPALVGICVNRIATPADEMIRDFDAFLIRSSCTPRRLCFSGLPDAYSIAEIFKKHPRISGCAIVFEVARAEAYLPTAFADLMTMFTRSDTAPYLEELCIGSYEPFTVNYSLLLKMLEVRRNAERPLREAMILMSGWDADPAAIAAFAALKRPGLSLAVGPVYHSHLRNWTYAPPDFGVL